MPHLHRLAPPLSALSLILPLAFCTGTPAPSSDSLHSHVVAVLGSVALTPLPAGDTLLSWNGDRLVLVHTGHRDSTGVTAGMFRFDKMVATWTEGEPEEQWRAAVLDGQHLLWLRRSLHPDDEKRPLEQTPLGREFERLHSVLAPATAPRVPQK